MNKKLQDLLVRVETWPENAQEDFAELGLEIEAVAKGGVYEATPAELAAIDEADRGRVATEAEVAVTLGRPWD